RRRSTTGKLSGNHNNVTTKLSAAITASTQKLNCHGPTNKSCAPNKGAKSGANIITSANREKNRTALSPLNKSRTTARAITAPAAPDTPCTNRNTMNTVTFGTNTHNTDVTVNTAPPTSNGPRRPQASLIGPITNCPNESPSIIAVSVSCTCASAVPNASVICGNAGKYMSVANGPMAVISPRTITSSTVAFRVRVTADEEVCSLTFERWAVAREFGDCTGTPIRTRWGP